MHENGDPIILTKNGHGDMVVMSCERYKQMLDAYLQLKQENARLKEETSPFGGNMDKVLGLLEEALRQMERKEQDAED